MPEKEKGIGRYERTEQMKVTVMVPRRFLPTATPDPKFHGQEFTSLSGERFTFDARLGHWTKQAETLDIVEVKNG